MKYIPQIIVKEDPAQEVKLFLSFLHHEYYKNLRHSILNNFPSLKESLDKSSNEEKCVAEFLDNFYKENRVQADRIIRESKNLFEDKSGEALKILGGLMDYEWEESVVYTATPTILSFSPFHGNTFFFSILSGLRNKETKEKNVLSVAVHEISHFVFLDQVKRLEFNNKIMKVSKETTDYIKESLAVVLLNQEPLKSLLEIEGYLGNPEIRSLRVKREARVLKISEFLNECFQRTKIENKMTFSDFLCEVFESVYPADSMFQEKRKIWNQLSLAKDNGKIRLETIYAEPIKVD
ncbi:MAG: hypothetical protein UX26_C0019G0003 [Parcubacteria group bacterium GW2011_GWC1_45_9]|nr:MAG: hypothetical protein UX26_C0019G0003 [Parcubacteria group bacterium GW2011_GWC1_45_9]HCI05539.1 hypothetical protein [Patescibacteria group bacterium]